MGKRWRKPKGEHQQSKKRKKQHGSGAGGPSRGAMGKMRSGFQGMFQSKTASRIFDVALWIAVAVAGFIFVQKRCMS